MIKFVTLKNNNGMRVTVSNWGARITSILFPYDNMLKEMLVSYANPLDYQHDEFYLGATCGRVCNRIARGQFSLNGFNYHLPKNNNGNCLHGGIENFSNRYWEIEELGLGDSSVRMTLFSEDGDQGFPGNVNVSVEYRLTNDNAITIQFLARTDKATPFNLTNHCYFNLGERDCRQLEVWLSASQYLEKNGDDIPTGKLLDVSETLFDFGSPRSLAKQESTAKDKAYFSENCYDHCYVLDTNNEYQAIVKSQQNGIQLSVKTDQPALQFYTGKYLSGEFSPYQGLCLEAQNYTDAINQPNFPDSVLRPKETYQRFICYGFSIT